jgi:hypothetical protein
MDADGYGGSIGARRMSLSSVSRSTLTTTLIQAGLREPNVPRASDEANPHADRDSDRWDKFPAEAERRRRLWSVFVLLSASSLLKCWRQVGDLSV